MAKYQPYSAAPQNVESARTAALQHARVNEFNYTHGVSGLYGSRIDKSKHIPHHHNKKRKKRPVYAEEPRSSHFAGSDTGRICAEAALYGGKTKCLTAKQADWFCSIGRM